MTKLNIDSQNIGQLLTVKTKNTIYEGYLLKINDTLITLKLLDNGYNIDVFLKNILDVSVEDKKITPGKIKSVSLPDQKDLPKVLFIATASKQTYFNVF